jgi:pimeloyl-ACP methyl ester carboxylesterase
MASIPSVLGGLAFLGASGALVYAGAVAGVVREALRPERRTIGWALARGLPSEPTAWGMPAREWIHAFDGATCPVFEIGEDDPSAPTAVVLHGFARSRYDALSRLEPMLPHARRFLLPDLPGHGDATGRGTRLGWDEDRFVLDLIERHATGPLLLAGHSLGATVAIHAAASEPIAARVRGVLAFAPYERLGTPLGARLHMRGMPRSALVPPALATLGMLGVRERSTRASAVRLHAPLAVLAGESDPVAPCAEARALANAARRARFAVIPNARHDDFHTLGREETTAALAWITHHA